MPLPRTRFISSLRAQMVPLCMLMSGIGGHSPLRSNAGKSSPATPDLLLRQRPGLRPALTASRIPTFHCDSNRTTSQLLQLHSKAARVNRAAKTDLLDWGFSDAVMALGPLRTSILEGIRQLVLKSLADSPVTSKADAEKPKANQEFIIVSHSLGSYLIFSALDVNQATEKSAAMLQAGNSFSEVLERTSSVYFFAFRT